MSPLRTQRDRAMVQAMALGGLRRAEVLGLRLEDLRLGEWRVFVNEGNGGHQRLVPVSPTFFATVASYMETERPPGAPTDRLFVVLKGPRRGQALSSEGLDELISGAGREPGWPMAPATSCATPASPASARRGCRSRPCKPKRAPLDRLDPAVLAPGGGLAGRRVPPGGGGHRSPGISGDVAMSALVVSKPAAPAKPVPARRAGIDAAAPVMAATMLAYLGRLSDELSAASVAAAEVTLRQFAGHVIATDPTCRSVAATGAEHVAAYRAELGQRWASSGERRVLSTTVDYRVATLHRFFGHIAAWGFADTPVVTPFGAGLASPGRPRRRGGGRPAKALAKKPRPRPGRPAQATWA